MDEEGKGRGEGEGSGGVGGKGRGGREEGRKHGGRTLCQVLPHEHPTSETDTN